MNSSIGIMLLLQIALIALNAIFSCAEIAVISMNDTRLARMAASGDKRALRLVRLTSQPARFLATIQVAITLSGFLGSAFAADHFSDMLAEWILGTGVDIPQPTLEAISVIFITLVLSYFTLIFGELVPKRAAMHKAEALALGLSGLIHGVAALFSPIVCFLTASTNFVLRLMGIDPNQQEDEVSEEEIRMMVDAGSEKGAIDRHEKEFIQNVFEFDDLTAAEIATHRTEMDWLDIRSDMSDWTRTIHETRHTLYPVCDDSADNIIGVLNAKDYFQLEDKSRTSVMEHAVHPAYFVPESLKADVLFRNMKQQHHRLSVVLDEYGGVVGIVTINDLIERLVGEIECEEPPAGDLQPSIEKLEGNLWKVHGIITLEALEETTDARFSNHDCDTLTGLAFSTLGYVPADGAQSIELSLDGINIHICRVEEHQVTQATLLIPPGNEPSAG